MYTTRGRGGGGVEEAFRARVWLLKKVLTCWMAAFKMYIKEGEGFFGGSLKFFEGKRRDANFEILSICNIIDKPLHE